MITSQQIHRQGNNRLKLKANIAIFAPVFSLLAACGGGSEAPPDSPDIVQTGRPANYMSGGAPGAADNVNLTSGIDFVATGVNGNASTTSSVDPTAGDIPVSSAIVGEQPDRLLAQTTAVGTADATSSISWTECAAESGVCSFAGTKEVRYGTVNTFVTKEVTGSTPCTNAVFGDPSPGYLKACSYSSSTVVTPGTGLSWTECAAESGVCSFTGTREVRYGTVNSFVTKQIAGSTPCTNSVFGDPAPGYVKACSYSSTTASTPGISARDPLKQPFASNSIWNMPIGSGAVYVPANISATPGNNIWATMPGIDDEKIILTPTAPLTNINYSSAAWSGTNRCGATGGLLLQVPMPSSYVVPHSTLNSSAAFLLADGRTIVQTQPLARCTAGAPGTSMAKFANVDLYGSGITGAHGGSGLSAIGGSIRMGELRPGKATGPKHALKVNVFAKEVLYKCTTRAACYRWPAVTSDSYAVGWYGSANGNSNTAMKMGALLAIPTSTSIGALGLETEPAKQLAWTLQNYGAYVVDDTYAAGFAFNAEDGPEGSKKTEFRNDWGFDMQQKVAGNTAWVRDIQRIVKALHVVNNNSPTAVGGGGTPRQALAPAIAP